MFNDKVFNSADDFGCQLYLNNIFKKTGRLLTDTIPMLEKLQANYRRALIGKVKRLEDLAQEYRHGRLEALDDILLMTHSLKGSGSTFGYPAISIAASHVDGSRPDELMQHLARLLSTMSQISAQGDAGKIARKILIIEDDTDISVLLDILLTRSLPGYEVLVAETVAAAMQYLAAHTFALVVLNLKLPDGDGRTLLKHIRDWHTSALPVLILSASDDQSIRAECLALGAKSFFKKPFDAAQLARSIKEEVLRCVSESEAESESGREPGPENKAVAAAPPEHIPEYTPEYMGKRVLFAEDDVLLAGIVIHRLAREGMLVDHVQEGDTALQYLNEQSYDLAIIDVKIPVMDGFEVLQEIRKRGTDMPVIILTAMGSENDIVRGFALGADHYVVKPFSPTELLARVKSLLNSGRTRTSQ